ncbi:patatin-like phospholipase family protein [Bacillus kwashiorkori]|uniref:patatin-like phospholipase family protein n=1 Tax=Bacillus kwashiorkori TaxID=1522318 RepID=UPI000781F17E|nr:patatin-like phospholipase family protein [Bacillus kwashiorkori]
MNVDGVFSGGGIKGIALIGACEALENRGIQFSRVAGTSAGAIIASLIVAGYSAKEIYDELNKIELSTLLDERKNLIPVRILKWLPLYWRLGLYKGQALEEWLKRLLASRGIQTFGDISPGRLRIIASDLTNGKMLILPDDLHKYDIPYENFSVAKAIRMSCSLPYFFEPVRLRTQKGEVIVVDGGVLSNFPMWLFDKENVKKIRPVIGIKLSPHFSDSEPKKIKNAFQMFEALFTTMKDAHDTRYISRKHVKDIIFIPTEGILTTEFSLTNEKKKALLQVGREETERFLKTWTY